MSTTEVAIVVVVVVLCFLENRLYEAFIYSLVFLFRDRDVLNTDCLLWDRFSI